MKKTQEIRRYVVVSFVKIDERVIPLVNGMFNFEEAQEKQKELHLSKIYCLIETDENGNPLFRLAAIE